MRGHFWHIGKNGVQRYVVSIHIRNAHHLKNVRQIFQCAHNMRRMCGFGGPDLPDLQFFHVYISPCLVVSNVIRYGKVSICFFVDHAARFVTQTIVKCIIRR